MATERQIAANRRNAQRSTGPKTEAGKARVRENALKHGMAAMSAGVVAGVSAAFDDRRAKWGAEFDPVGEGGAWALDRAVAASLQIERCEAAIERVMKTARERAELAWDQDRAVEAATIAERLAKHPALASRQLEASLAGVELLIDNWFGLCDAIESKRDWSEAEAGRALDLLGVPAEFRTGRTPIDAPEGADALAFRKALALGEITRLEELRDDCMVPLDAMDHQLALDGDLALLSKEAKLILRYEREAWRRYREAIREVKSPTPSPAPAPVMPAVVVAPSPRVEPPRPAERVVEEPGLPTEAERRAIREQAAAILANFPEQVAAIGRQRQAEPDWLDELEQRMDRFDAARKPALPGSFVPIAAGVRLG